MSAQATDPGACLNSWAARCHACLARDVATPATGYHPVTGAPACDKHQGCTCGELKDPGCPVHRSAVRLSSA